MILPLEFVIRDSAVRPARNAFDEVRGNAMMDLSNQDASFTTGCVAWQAGIRLLKKDVSGLYGEYPVNLFCENVRKNFWDGALGGCPRMAIFPIPEPLNSEL